MNAAANVLHFPFLDHDLRWFARAGSRWPWCYAGDVCDALTVVNVSQAVERIDAQHTGSIYIEDRTSRGGNPNVLVIDLPGAIQLGLTSRKTPAKEWTRYLFDEVLPHFLLTDESPQSRGMRDLLGIESAPIAANDTPAPWMRLEGKQDASLRLETYNEIRDREHLEACVNACVYCMLVIAADSRAYQVEEFKKASNERFRIFNCVIASYQWLTVCTRKIKAKKSEMEKRQGKLTLRDDDK